MHSIHRRGVLVKDRRTCDHMGKAHMDADGVVRIPKEYGLFIYEA